MRKRGEHRTAASACCARPLFMLVSMLKHGGMCDTHIFPRSIMRIHVRHTFHTAF